MKQKTSLKLFAALLSLLLTTVCLSGCVASEGEGEPAAKTEYYEMATELPDAMLIDAAAVDGVLGAIMITDNGYERFTKTETGWDSKPISAITSLEAKSLHAYHVSLAPEGGVYILCVEDGVGVSLWYSSDLENYELVADNEKLRMSDADLPKDFTGLGGGLVAGNYSGGREANTNSETLTIGVFDVKTGETHKISGAKGISRSGDKLIVCNNFEGDMRLIDPKTWEETVVPTDFFAFAVCENAENGVLVASNSVVYSGNPNDTLWLELFSYKDICMGRSDMWVQKLFTIDDVVYIEYTDAEYMTRLMAVAYGVPEAA